MSYSNYIQNQNLGDDFFDNINLTVDTPNMLTSSISVVAVFCMGLHKDVVKFSIERMDDIAQRIQKEKVKLIYEKGYLEQKINITIFSYKEFLINFKTLSEFSYVEHDNYVAVLNYKNDIASKENDKSLLDDYAKIIPKEKLFSYILENNLDVRLEKKSNHKI